MFMNQNKTSETSSQQQGGTTAEMHLLIVTVTEYDSFSVGCVDDSVIFANVCPLGCSIWGLGKMQTDRQTDGASGECKL